jgi:AraC family transcriptional regulator
MILRRFPDTVPSPQEHLRVYSAFGRENIVIYAQSENISYGEHTAPLSIKSTLKGSEVYEVERVPLAVDENAYLVLNNDQPYASYIYSAAPVKSFCLFFRDGLDKEVLRAMNFSAAYLLDNTDENSDFSAPFFQNLRQRDTLVSPLLNRLQAQIAKAEPPSLWFEEQFHGLMEALLVVHQLVIKDIEKLPALKKATRFELYKRLSRAKDFMDSCYRQPLTLDEIARVACLSKHHFLRLFKQMYRLTPHRYLVNLRLQRAKELITASDLSITEIYVSLGFENASSFARLFKQHFQQSPRQVRQQVSRT